MEGWDERQSCLADIFLHMVTMEMEEGNEELRCVREGVEGDELEWRVEGCRGRGTSGDKGCVIIVTLFL